MPDRQKELSDYRLQQAEESRTVAKTCISNEFESDYDDFYIASKEEAEDQIKTAELVLQSVKEYLKA